MPMILANTGLRFGIFESSGCLVRYTLNNNGNTNLLVNDGTTTLATAAVSSLTGYSVTYDLGSTTVSEDSTVPTFGITELSTLFSGDIDDSFVTVPLPFNIKFLGTRYNQIFAGTNGYIAFDAGRADITPSGFRYLGFFLGDKRLLSLHGGSLTPGQYTLIWRGYNYLGSSGNQTTVEFTFFADDNIKVSSGAKRAIFAFGISFPNRLNMSNYVTDRGLIVTDTTGVGTARHSLAAASYGGDKAIFGFGSSTVSYVNITNLVSNLGVVAADGSALTDTARVSLAAASYGGDKAIFGFGHRLTGFTSGSIVNLNITNLVSNTGVVALDQSALTGTARHALAAAGYGGDKAIFGFGYSNTYANITNLVSNTGVVAADQNALTGTARSWLAAAGYGGDKAIFGWGNTNVRLNITNLVSNTGVVVADQTALTGTARSNLAAASYGGDKAIFGFGYSNTYANITNLVSNTGVVASELSGVGTARDSLAAAGYSS